MDINTNKLHEEQPKKRIFIAVGTLLVVIAGFFILWDKESKLEPNSTPISALVEPIIQPNLVATGFQTPTGITSTNIPDDKRLFVVQRSGVIKIVDQSGETLPNPYLDINQKVQNSGEMGLLGLVFHPTYKENGYFYINYVDKDQNTVIARYNVSADENTANENSEKVIFKLKQPYTNHNGGDLAFGPDGYLYIALGDGGSGGDPQNYAQNQDSYLGKILRVDVNSGDPYVVPSTNPFVGQTGIKPEIWAIGLRNPWRFSFDRQTGDLYIADVGQDKMEELNFQSAESKGGENYGWRCYEGTAVFKLDGCPDVARFTPPIVEYNRDEGRCSITGGYVYRGVVNKALTGKYFYGDFCNGQLFYAVNKNDKWSQVLAAKTPYKISAFGQGSDGELYFTDFETGSLYKIHDSAN